MNLQARRYIFEFDEFGYVANKFCRIIKRYKHELDCLRIVGEGGKPTEVSVDGLAAEDIEFIEELFDFADIDPETVIVRRERK